MSEKELLYIEDVLNHFDYLMRHLCINKECLTLDKASSLFSKIEKKTNSMYEEFYNLLKGE